MPDKGAPYEVTPAASASVVPDKGAPHEVAPVAAASVVPAALVALLFHLAIAGQYGWFRDEFYYIDAGKHLSGGYVEFPAMVALLSDFQRAVFGPSLWALHVLPAVASAALVVLTALMAREMGGGSRAQGLAALWALCAPVFVGAAALFTMDIFDELWWAAAALVLLRMLRTGAQRLWLLCGLIAGLALLTKLTFLAFALALTIGLLATPARCVLRTRWPYLAAGLAFLFLLPYLAWQPGHDWATLGFWRNYGAKQDTVTFVTQVILLMQPLALPLWGAGLWYLLRDQEGQRYRPFAWAFLFLLVLFAARHAKSYFLVPAMPPLLAAGTVVVERHVRRVPGSRLVPVTAVALLLGGLVLAPVVAPILPPKTLASVMSSPIQPVADRFGWPQYVGAVARVYRTLPPAMRRQTTILAGNYGEAGALDLLGPAQHLPRAISPQNTYWFWGRSVTPGQVVIATDVDPVYLATVFASVHQRGVVPAQDGIQNQEVGTPIFVCRGLKVPWPTVWAHLKNFS